jgi:hypothetical protein
MLQSRISRLAVSALLPAQDQGGAAETGNRLFEHLLSEVHATAVDISVVTTAVNTLNDWRTRIDPVDLARFSPHGATLRALVPILDDNRCLEQSALADLLKFLSELEAARAALDSYLDDCETISPARSATVHASLLQSIWRPLSGEARHLILRLEQTAPTTLPDLFIQNTRVVSALLAGAANGLRPCLDSDGRLYVPPLPQRRRAPRRTVLQNCVIHGEDFVQTAFVRDASAGGLGLSRISRLKRGERVRIEMANGRILHGTVAWVTGGTAGVRFDVALPVTDSLIAI